jgi:hypothetical protein
MNTMGNIAPQTQGFMHASLIKIAIYICFIKNIFFIFVDFSAHYILLSHNLIVTTNQYYHYSNSAHVAQTESSIMKSDCDNFNITPAIHRAVFVNNEGTKLVRQCQYDAAVKSFTAVLKILKPLAALVEANDKNETTEIRNGDCIPISISFTNNTTTDDIGSSSSDEHTNINMRTSFDSFASLRQIDLESSEETQPQLPSSSETYWNGGLSPRPSMSASRKKQRRLSATAAAKLHAVVGSPNQFAQRKISHFVFRDPVEIPPESVPSNVSVEAKGEQSCELFSKFLMIVMYNLALTLHLHAMSLSNANGNQKSKMVIADSGDNADQIKAKKLFLRSRKLYELAFEMHLDESCDVNLLFTLALINNLGLVYDIMGQKQRSKTCFKNMFSTMMYLMDSNESQTVKEWDGLLSNVMDILFQQHRDIAAPAA